MGAKTDGDRNRDPRCWMIGRGLDDASEDEPVGAIIMHWMDDAFSGCQQQTAHCRVVTCADSGRWSKPRPREQHQPGRKKKLSTLVFHLEVELAFK